MHLGPKINVLTGANGQGKTNVVEAVSFLSWLRSFRTAKTGDLVQHGCESAFIVAHFGRGNRQEQVEITIGRGFRKVLLGGKPLKSPRQMLQEIPVVWLSPEDPAVLNGGPQGRRLLVDGLSATLFPQESGCLSQYEKILQERNRLLKIQGPVDSVLADALEERLAQAGAALYRLRMRSIEEIMGSFPKVMQMLSGDVWEASMDCRPTWMQGDCPEKSLQKRLAASRHRDQMLGYTTQGPHTDDIDVYIQGQRVRGVASRGQLKILLLAFKIAQAIRIADFQKVWPLLVLDDVLGDLDCQRQGRVLAFLEGYAGQSFVTTPVPMAVHSTDMCIFRVEDGVVTKEQPTTGKEEYGEIHH